MGGAVTLAEIADYEATPANIIHYAKIVRDRAIKRSLISTASEIVALGYEHGESADSLLDEAESRIFGLSTEKASTSLSSISVEMHDAVNHIDMLMNRSGELTGLSTGYEKLDEMTGGMQPRRPLHPGRAAVDGQDGPGAQRRRAMPRSTTARRSRSSRSR